MDTSEIEFINKEEDKSRIKSIISINNKYLFFYKKNTKSKIQFIKLIILAIVIFLIYKLINYLYQMLGDKNLSKYPEEIYSKNENIENNNITTELIEKRILENRLILRSNITFNESYLSNISILSKKIPNIDEILYFRTIPLTIDNIKDFNLCNNPNISIIIPIYNSQNEILYLHKSIQNQSLENIEIIYVDDCSSDNSTKIIQNIQEKDRRTILLRNKVNKGPFYSRNKGALFAKGEYIQFMDSDDLLIGNILEKTYFIAKIKNLDVVQYKFFVKRGVYKIFDEYLKKDVIFQPELSDLMYYGRGYLFQTNFFIYNKIIKTEVFLKALIYIGDDILKEKLYFNEDLLQLFSVLRIANSFLYIDDVGYANLDKINSGLSLFGNRHNKNYANRILHDNFIEVKLIYNKTENNAHDKAICIEFLKMTINQYSVIFKYVTEGYALFDEVFSLLLNSGFFNNQLNILNSIKRDIMVNRNNNTN